MRSAIANAIATAQVRKTAPANANVIAPTLKTANVNSSAKKKKLAANKRLGNQPF